VRSSFAHPDLIRFTGDAAVYERAVRRLCRAAAKRGTILEYNLLGLREARHYPDERFWRIAAEEGCRAILGLDAHAPEQLSSRDGVDEAFAALARLGVSPVEDLPLVKI